MGVTPLPPCLSGGSLQLGRVAAPSNKEDADEGEYVPVRAPAIAAAMEEEEGTREGSGEDGADDMDEIDATLAELIG